MCFAIDRLKNQCYKYTLAFSTRVVKKRESLNFLRNGLRIHYLKM